MASDYTKRYLAGKKKTVEQPSSSLYELARQRAEAQLYNPEEGTVASDYTRRYLAGKKKQERKPSSLHEFARQQTEVRLPSHKSKSGVKFAVSPNRVNKLDVQDERAYQSKKRSSFSERMKTAGSSSVLDQMKSFDNERRLVRQYERDKREKIVQTGPDQTIDSRIRRGLAYGTERAGATLLGAAEGLTDTIGAGIYGTLAAASSLGGLAPNAVSDWAIEQGEAFLDNSITRDFEKSIEERYNPTQVEQMATGVGQAVTQMLPAIGVSKWLGAARGVPKIASAAKGILSGEQAGQLLFGLQVAGNSASQAKQEGADFGESLAYGVSSGLMESLIERVSGGIPGLGNGFLDDVAARVASNPIVLNALDILGEGGEEAVSAILDPYIRRAIYDPDAENATPEEIAESAVTGALAAGILKGGLELPSFVSDRFSARSAAKSEMVPPSATRIDILYQLAQDMANDRLGGVNEDKVSVAPRPSNPYTVYTQGPQPAQKVNPARDPAMVDYIAETLGKNGSVSMRRLYDGEMDTDAYSAEFLESYSAGMRGDEKPAPQSLTPAQSEAAYVAGQADRKGKAAAPIGRQTGGDIYGRTEEALVGRHEARGYDPGGAGGPVLRERGAAQTGDSRANRGNEAIPADRPGPAGAGEAGREVIQTARSWQEDPAAFTTRSTERDGVVRQMGNVSVALGERGSEALTAIYDGSVDADSFYDGFSAYYHAGVAGMDMDKVKTGSSTVLNSVQRKAAYLAGQNDAEAGFRREQRAAQYAKSAGSDSGLIYDDFVRQAVESGRTMEDVNGETREYLNADTAAKINRVAKALGVRVQFVDSISVNGHNDAANAQIKGSEVQIQRDNENPVMFLVGHEITHRIQELAPKEYRAFRAAAANDRIVQAAVKMQMENHARRGVDITYEEALDEAASDYAGRLIDDGEVLDDFIARNREDRTLLQKVRDAIRSIIKKLTGAEREKAQTAEGKLTAALEAAARQARRLQDENTDGTMSTARNSFKEDLEHGRTREETRGAFLRRANGDGLAVYEGETAAYGFRRVGDASAGGYPGEATREARETWRELTALGISSDVIEGPVLRNRGGITVARDVPQAVTADGSHIFISKDASISPRNVAGHEAFHLWKRGKGRDAYIEIVEENLIYTHPSFLHFQSTIAESYLGGEADLSNDAQMNKLREEILAYISGNIHEGTNDADMRPMFYDFDAVKTAWDTLVKENTVGTRLPMKTPSAEDAQFSLKGDTVSKSYAAILEENQLLRERVEYWKGQTRKTKRVTTDKKAVEQSARELIHSYGSDLAVDDISGDLQSLYDYIASGYDGKNELTYTEARRRAEAIARQLVGKAVAADTELYDQYSDLRNYLRTTKLIVSEADSHNIPDYGAWRKQRFGRLNLTRGDVTNIDQVYEDLSERWPEFFNSQREISTADQLLRIAEVADTLYDITEYNPFSEYMEQAVDGAANEVMEIFFDLPQTRKTFADRQAMKLQEAKAKGQRQAQRIREQNSTRLETLRQENRERVRRAVQRERDARTRQLDRMKEHYQARDAAGRERRSAAELRRKITRHAKALSQKLLRPTDKQHIPENLRTAVASLLDAINLESVYTVDPETGKRRKNGEGEPVKRTEAFRALRLAYAEIAKDGGDYTLIIDPDLMDNLNELESMKNTPIAEMGTDQLATVWASLKAVEASIRTVNKMLGTSRFETISSFADGIRADNILRKDRGDYRGVAGKIDRLVNLDMLTPQSYFHRLGKTGEELFRMMRAAQDRHITIMRQAQKKTAEIIGKTDINKLEREKHTFDLSGGDVTMSTAQIMGLYELMKRKQAQDHILKGGIRPDTIQSGRGLREDRRSEPVKVSVEDLAAITGMLTEEQIRIADRLQKFMGGTLAELGNEASMAVYGYRKFTEKDYYPIKVDKNQTRRDISKEAQATTIAGRGFTKSVIPKANNAVMVESIFDTYSNHVNDMATYAAWLPTMENIRRIRDFTFRDDKGSRTGDVKSIIERVFGRNGNAYLNKLVDDINQGVRANGTGNFTDSLVGNYKAAAVAANIRVILQQPTAILRAMNSLDPKYLLSGTVKRGDWDKVKRYAPIAVWKDWGYFDINTGRQMKDVLFSSDSKMEKVKQAAMAGASKADSFAWARLWNAVEAEMRDKRHDLKPGTDAFYQAVGTRFSEIVDQTQVVDGLLQRSQIMRSPDALTKMATSFMAEPTKTYNMFVNAVYDLRHATGKDARNDTKRALARTSAALVVSFAVNAVMQSIVDALRDDDKERDYWEKFLTAYTGFTGEEETFLDYWNSFWDGNLEANFNPAGYIPYFKDLLSIMQGYDVSRMDMEPVSKVLEAAANMKKALSGEGRHSLAGASANLMGEVSRLLGIPIANLKRDVQSVIATAAIEMDDYLMQYRIDSAMLNMNYSGNFKNFMDILYSASKNDPEVYEIIYDDMVKQDLFKTSTQTTEERIASAMESRMKRDQGVESVEDLQNRFLSPDSSRTYDRILKKASSSAIWKSAGSEVIKEAENKIYQISAGTKTGEKLKEKIEAGAPYGIDEADYVLYQMALDIADAQNKDPEKRNESFDQAEAEEAINMLTGLSDSAKSYLWQSTNKAWKSENNPWGGLAPNEEDISIEAKDEAVNRLLSGIYW